MQQIFGNFVEPKNGAEYLIVRFSPTSLPLQQRWQNTGLSADFLAEYWTSFFPAHDIPSRNKQQEIKGAVNYVANELLENVMKFNYQPADYPVSLGLYLYQNHFRFYATNAIDPRVVEDFQARIQNLLRGDPQALYLEQVEKNAAEDSYGSHIGLLTILSDYGAQLAWKFETISRETTIITVTTMAQLDLFT
ncbi:MAG: ATP-binding protein [Anaerolineae bacterium]|nr:ATP-binding protein [Anaerolineae bacterium]